MGRNKFAKCIGCGYCCKKASCSISVQLFGNSERCPVLSFDGNRYGCGLISMSEGEAKEHYIEQLAIGAGCSSSLNTDRNIVTKKTDIMFPVPPKNVLISFLKSFSGQMYNSDMLFMMLNTTKHDLKENGFNEEDINDTINKIKICMGLVRCETVHDFMG